MRNFILTVAALMFCTMAQAQPALLNSAGGSATIGGNTYEWSVGEAVTSTASVPGLIVTQGLLQPMPPSVGINGASLALADIQAYPNPASDVLILQPNLPTGGDMQYQLLDITGRILIKENATLLTGREKQSVHMGALPPGSYIVQVQVLQPGGTLYASFNVRKLD
ncbi:MAG: T9SS type A sorting domain-containing protein [Taibaiella sp.]|nr:T9SS type A sorting domain-containing protein [Taibaiella sp.]